MDTSVPTTITDNFIDGTYSANAPANANSDIRIDDQFGNVSNITVSGNFLLGGGYTVEVGQVGTEYTISNVAIANNYIGFYWYGGFYPNTQNYTTMTGNTIVSYANPNSSAQALAGLQEDRSSRRRM